MTEIPETEPTVMQRAPGEILKQARQGKDLSIAAIATQLNLDLRTIEALESGDLSKLPAPIFVRGYLRGYARLVGVHEDEVLAAYQSLAPQEPAPRPVSMARKSMRPAFLMPAIPWRGLFGGLVLIGLILLAVEIGPQLMNKLSLGDAPESTPMTGLALPVPGSDMPAAQEQLQSAPAITNNMALVLPEPTLSAAEDLQSPADEVIEPTTPGDLDFGASAMPDAVVVPPVPALSSGQVQLDFSFISDSWVEVRAADSSNLLIGLLRKDEQRSVTGQAPISVLFGNAAAVTLKVNGKLFDHGQYSRGNVARFTVPAQP